MSLSGYEELAADEEEEEEETALSQSHGSGFGNSTSHTGDETVHTDGEEHETYDQGDDSLLDNVDISGSTPRAPQAKSAIDDGLKFAGYPSPYEDLKRELKGRDDGLETDDNVTQVPPTTPGPEQRLPDMSMTPTSSPFAPTSYVPSTAQRPPNGDLLLHRVLDKNYRLQATPHTTRKEKKVAVKASWREAASPLSSPPTAAPQLRSEIFSSPIKAQETRLNAPRTPGISVNTPARARAKKEEISWESDSDQDADDVYKELGMSPPKTIQFAIAPSRLLQTPGKLQ